MTARDPLPIGKRYDGGTWVVRQAAFRAYADATDDTNPLYRGEAAIAPPMFHVRPMIDLMLGMARDPELGIDLLRLVHGEHAMHFHRPMRDGDALALGGRLLSVDDKSSGRVFTFALEGRIDGELALEGTTTYFVRAPAPPPDGSRAPRAPEPEPPPAHWTRRQRVTEDQALRYAAASGDDNAIHTDPEVARKAGLPRPILHGLCTLAFAARDLIDRYADGDASRLELLAVRWARPVLPGTDLVLEVWEDGLHLLEFRTLGPDGKAVLVQGRAHLRAG